ncbi:response regulator [Desulfohalovibrio reitneri]|uniref:response regulator n=1 Tax=Desulfohalovibrio reitneri TaxID=1307759 RepID=UPI00068A8758|nr:response regulator [Desulfohalovibrio reitneri]
MVENIERGRAIRVLLVDDDPETLDILEEILEKEGYEVYTASDGKLAMELFTEAIDLVVTDVLMPHQDGLELVLALRECSPATPVLAISGGGLLYEPHSCLKMAEKLGVSGVLQKDTLFRDIIGKIREILGT